MTQSERHICSIAVYGCGLRVEIVGGRYSLTLNVDTGHVLRPDTQTKVLIPGRSSSATNIQSAQTRRLKRDFAKGVDERTLRCDHLEQDTAVRPQIVSIRPQA